MFKKTSSLLIYINSKKVSILIIALLLSISYIWYGEFKNYRLKIVQNSYSKWMEVALWEIMRQALDESCKPINIWDSKTQVDLINIECLKPKQPQNQPPLQPEENISE